MLYLLGKCYIVAVTDWTAERGGHRMTAMNKEKALEKQRKNKKVL